MNIRILTIILMMSLGIGCSDATAPHNEQIVADSGKLTLNQLGSLQQLSLKCYRKTITNNDIDLFMKPHKKDKNISNLLFITLSAYCPVQYIEHVYDNYPIGTKAANRVGQSALHIAVRTNTPDMVEKLLDYGFGLNSVFDGVDRGTPLEQAILGDNLSNVKLLLKQGADIKTVGIKRYKTLKDYCTKFQTNPPCKYLIEFLKKN